MDQGALEGAMEMDQEASDVSGSNRSSHNDALLIFKENNNDGIYLLPLQRAGCSQYVLYLTDFALNSFSRKLLHFKKST